MAMATRTDPRRGCGKDAAPALIMLSTSLGVPYAGAAVPCVSASGGFREAGPHEHAGSQARRTAPGSFRAGLL